MPTPVCRLSLMPTTNDDDDVLDDMVEPLLVIGPVDAHDDCLIMALEP